MLRPVAFIRIDVSKEHIASNIKVTRIGELGTTLNKSQRKNTAKKYCVRKEALGEQSSHLDQPDYKPNSVAFLPFVGTIPKRISRMLARQNIKSVGFLHMKLSSLLRPVRDYLGLRTPDVYRIPCQCGRIYTGQTGRSADISLEEHPTGTSGQAGRS
jgi:hypothetical protein